LRFCWCHSEAEKAAGDEVAMTGEEKGKSQSIFGLLGRVRTKGKGLEAELRETLKQKRGSR